MLATATLQTLLCTTRLDAARHFYGEVLGLPLTGQSHGALLFAVGDAQLRVSPVARLVPSEHTVLGFAVVDLDHTMIALAKKGVRFERFAALPQDAQGVLIISDGTRVAWFKDPDGNMLSVVQYA